METYETGSDNVKTPKQKKERTQTQKCMYFSLLYRKGVMDKETYLSKIAEVKAGRR